MGSWFSLPRDSYTLKREPEVLVNQAEAGRELSGKIVLSHSNWQGFQGPEQFFELQLSLLRVVPKKWWIITFADQWDLNLSDCHLAVKENKLSELWESLLLVVSGLAYRSLDSPHSGPPQDLNSALNRLVHLPPRLTCHSFSCRLQLADGRAFQFRAAVAELQPPLPLFTLRDRVRITSPDGSELTGEEVQWLPLEKLLILPGRFVWLPGKGGRRQGERGQFRLAADRLAWIPGSDQILVLRPVDPMPMFFPFKAAPANLLTANRGLEFMARLFWPGSLFRSLPQP